MDKVVLITGASSGIGNQTAKLFQTKNWRVAATMRRPDEAADLQNIADIECIELDVTDIDSIRAAIAQTLELFGRIDAVVNNAGFAVVGPFEAVAPEDIERQMRTNVFGLMNVCREVLPIFREQKGGTIVNIASVGGRLTFPLYSVYHASKWAVEGFSESLQFEVRDLGIKIKIVEPGPIKTDFYSRSMTIAANPAITAYDRFVARVLPNLQHAGETAPDGRIVAETICNAVNDGTWTLRYPVNARPVLILRRFLPDRIFLPLIKRILSR